MRNRLRVYVLGLVLALIATTQCYAYCDTAAYLAVSAPMSSHCPRHTQHQHSNRGKCVPPHSELASPEHGVRIPALGCLHFSGNYLSSARLPIPERELVPVPLRAPVFPPGAKIYLSVSLLRI